jgi:hypothetical protein
MPVSEPTDLELARAAAQDDAAWNALVARFGDLILAHTMITCETNCRIPRTDYDCILRTITAQRPEPAESPEGCREGLSLYRFACTELRQRLTDFTGTTTLEEFILAALAQSRATYLTKERGRLNLPTALEGAPLLVQDVFRLACRTPYRADVALQLNTTPEAVSEAERDIAQRFAAANLGWRGLEPAQVPAKVAEAPGWVHRGVLVGNDSPEPVRKGDTWARRALWSQPDWLVGLVVGAVTTAMCLLVVIPRQEYVKSVREPADVLLAGADRPLAPPLAAKLADARTALGRGQVDTAVQDLTQVLAVRGDDQEARWLLATTYDRLGDQPRAAKHYKLFLDVDQRTRAASDDRVARAQTRLGHWAEMP